MSKRISSVILLSFLVMALSAGCAMTTRVIIETNVPNARVLVNGMDVGNTPAVTRMSNAIWDDPEIVIEKKGYRTLRASATKEIKVGNGLIGFFLFWPAFGWCYGPQSHQYYTLIPLEED